MITRANIERFVEEVSPEEDLLLADGLDEAFIGIGQRIVNGVAGGVSSNVAIYDTDRCIDIFMARDGMTREEAEEYFRFNVAGAWVGDGTPMFIETLSRGRYDAG